MLRAEGTSTEDNRQQTEKPSSSWGPKKKGDSDEGQTGWGRKNQPSSGWGTSRKMGWGSGEAAAQNSDRLDAETKSVSNTGSRGWNSQRNEDGTGSWDKQKSTSSNMSKGKNTARAESTSTPSWGQNSKPSGWGSNKNIASRESSESNMKNSGSSSWGGNGTNQSGSGWGARNDNDTIVRGTDNQANNSESDSGLERQSSQGNTFRVEARNQALTKEAVDQSHGHEPPSSSWGSKESSGSSEGHKGWRKQNSNSSGWDRKAGQVEGEGRVAAQRSCSQAATEGVSNSGSIGCNSQRNDVTTESRNQIAMSRSGQSGITTAEAKPTSTSLWGRSKQPSGWGSSIHSASNGEGGGSNQNKQPSSSWKSEKTRDTSEGSRSWSRKNTRPSGWGTRRKVGWDVCEGEKGRDGRAERDISISVSEQGSEGQAKTNCVSGSGSSGQRNSDSTEPHIQGARPSGVQAGEGTSGAKQNPTSSWVQNKQHSGSGSNENIACGKGEESKLKNAVSSTWGNQPKPSGSGWGKTSALRKSRSTKSPAKITESGTSQVRRNSDGKNGKAEEHSQLLTREVTVACMSPKVHEKGRGRGRDMNLPAWLTQQHHQVGTEGGPIGSRPTGRGGADSKATNEKLTGGGSSAVNVSMSQPKPSREGTYGSKMNAGVAAYGADVSAETKSGSPPILSQIDGAERHNQPTSLAVVTETHDTSRFACVEGERGVSEWSSKTASSGWGTQAQNNACVAEHGSDVSVESGEIQSEDRPTSPQIEGGKPKGHGQMSAERGLPQSRRTSSSVSLQEEGGGTGWGSKRASSRAQSHGTSGSVSLQEKDGAAGWGLKRASLSKNDQGGWGSKQGRSGWGTQAQNNVAEPSTDDPVNGGGENMISTSS